RADRGLLPRVPTPLPSGAGRTAARGDPAAVRDPGLRRGTRRGDRRVVARGARARVEGDPEPGRLLGRRVASRLAHLARDAAAVPGRRRVGARLAPGVRRRTTGRMSTKTIQNEFRGEDRRRFTQALLKDVSALERLLASGMLEEGVRRIGAEQEVFLVDKGLHPALASTEVIAALGDPHYTTELGLFQLEMNLEPQVFSGDCL